MDDQALKEDSGYLLHNHGLLRLREQVKEHATEVVRMIVGVAQLIRDRIQHVVATLRIQPADQNLE